MSFEGGDGGINSPREMSYAGFLEYYTNFNQHNDGYFLKYLANFFDNTQDLMTILQSAHKFWKRTLIDLQEHQEDKTKDKTKQKKIYEITKKNAGVFLFNQLKIENPNIEYFGQRNTSSIFGYYLNYFKKNVQKDISLNIEETLQTSKKDVKIWQKKLPMKKLSIKKLSQIYAIFNNRCKDWSYIKDAVKTINPGKMQIDPLQKRRTMEYLIQMNDVALKEIDNFLRKNPDVNVMDIARYGLDIYTSEISPMNNNVVDSDV